MGDFRPHRFQPLDVLFDWAGANRATAGQRHPGFAKPSEQRTQHQNRGAHGLDHVVGRVALVYCTSVKQHLFAD